MGLYAFLDTLDFRISLRDTSTSIRHNFLYFIHQESNLMIGLLVLSCFLMVFISLILAIGKLGILLSERITNTWGVEKLTVHSLKQNYQNISYLSHNHDSRLIPYVDKSANYYSLLLNMRRKDWTLAEELELFNAFCDAESVLNKYVEIIVRADGIDKNRVQFIPNIFATLLENSLKHAFKTKSDKCIFLIEVEKVKHKLLVTVSDNGTPSNNADYIRKDRPNRGLSLLNKRIQYERFFFRPKIRILPLLFNTHSIGIQISTENTGTIINFSVPYYEY